MGCQRLLDPRSFSFLLQFPPVKSGFDGRNVTSQLMVAALAAGVVTSYAVSQGQNPLIALGITIFSAVTAVALGQWI